MHSDAIKAACDLLAAVLGFAKEGVGLSDKLRKRHERPEDSMLARTFDSQQRGTQAKKAIAEIHEALRLAVPQVRRIVKRRIVLRLEVLGGALAVMAFGFSYGPADWTRALKGSAEYLNTWWIGGVFCIILFFACSWILRIGEFKFSDKFDPSEKNQYLPIWGRLPKPIRVVFSSLLRKIWARERQGLNIADRTLLVEYGKLSSLIQFLETQAIAEACSIGLTEAEVYLRAETDECVWCILADEINRVHGGANFLQTDWLGLLYEGAGIGFVVDSVRYKKALENAVDAFGAGRDGRAAYWVTLTSEDKDALDKLIVSGRPTMGERFQSLSRRAGKAFYEATTSRAKESCDGE